MDNRPNIIFILSDDQGAWAMHCAGTPELYTPNLDRIAAEGMRFENFFCVSPVCSPARASLLTGNIPSAHGVHDWIRSGNVDGEKFWKQGMENPYGGGYARETKPAAYLEGQENPRVIEEKLKSFLSPKDRQAQQEEGGGEEVG